MKWHWSKNGIAVCNSKLVLPKAKGLFRRLNRAAILGLGLRDNVCKHCWQRAIEDWHDGKDD